MLYSTRYEHVQLELHHLQILVVVLNDGLSVELLQALTAQFVLVVGFTLHAKLVLDDASEKWISIHELFLLFRRLSTTIKLRLPDLDRIVDMCEDGHTRLLLLFLVKLFQLATCFNSGLLLLHKMPRANSI